MMLVAHPLGNACVRALLSGLQARGLLAGYVTTLGFHRDDWWIDGMPPTLRRQLERRLYDLPRELVERRPWREIARLAGTAAGISSWIEHEKGWASVDAVFRDLDRQAATQLRAMPAVRAVYAYEDGARELFSAAEDRGLPRCYELPMGYWREAQRMFREEAELQPAWADTLDGLRDSEEKLERKDQEVAHASHVIVASEFSRRSLAAYPSLLQASISVVPHGAPKAVDEAELKARLHHRPAGALRVLFVGGLTQRKGLSYLFEGMKSAGSQASLTVVGRGTDRRCSVLDDALRRHEYVASLPAGSLFALMRRHDVLVLPSLFEGFGLVLLEAMAQGLPVIATPHSAAPELLSGAEAGLMVPIRSADAIASAIEVLASNPPRREAMALAARQAAERFKWDECSARLGEFCRQVIKAKVGSSK